MARPLTAYFCTAYKNRLSFMNAYYHTCEMDLPGPSALKVIPCAGFPAQLVAGGRVGNDLSGAFCIPNFQNTSNKKLLFCKVNERLFVGSEFKVLIFSGVKKILPTKAGFLYKSDLKFSP